MAWQDSHLKLCVLGEPGSGRHRLARQLVGLGPATEHVPRLLLLRSKRTAEIPHVLWLPPARCLLDSLNQSFLRHADGWLLIAADDAAVELATQLRERADRLIGPRAWVGLRVGSPAELAPSRPPGIETVGSWIDIGSTPADACTLLQPLLQHIAASRPSRPTTSAAAQENIPG
jgi:hypothetical protein